MTLHALGVAMKKAVRVALELERVDACHLVPRTGSTMVVDDILPESADMTTEARFTSMIEIRIDAPRRI